MYDINPNILKTPVSDGQILLLEPQAGLYFELNETSVLIFYLLADGASPQKVVAQLVNDYEVDERIAQRDTDDLIAQLLEHNIITVRNNG